MPELSATIGPQDAGRKIKYFVRGTLRVSYHQYCVMKAEGDLRVNGQTVHADYLLREGDFVTARLTDAPPAKPVDAQAGPLNIVYEDDDLLIIDKSAPLACQCTPRQPTGTLENRLRARCGPDFVFRPLNRLDRGTSGLMAAAKHAHACQLLQKQLHGEAFLRRYLAVCEGAFSGEGVIRLPIAKAAEASVRRVIDPENGREAVTHYRVEATDGARSLVRLRLETGRTHQIRVHLRAIGHPVCGDFLYGTELDALPGRFALHSCEIALTQPLSGAALRFESPLPEALRRLMRL